MRLSESKSEITYINLGYEDYSSIIRDNRRKDLPSTINLYITDLSDKSISMINHLVSVLAGRKIDFNIIIDTIYGYDIDDLLDENSKAIINMNDNIHIMYGSINQ